MGYEELIFSKWQALEFRKIQMSLLVQTTMPNGIKLNGPLLDL